MATGIRRRPKIFYGWIVVAAVSARFLYAGGTYFYGFGTFFMPVVKEFEWSRTATSVAFSLYRLEAGIEAPLVGWLIDKMGPRTLMVIGSVIMGFAFIAMSQIQNLWSFYAAFVFLALGFGTGYGPASAAAVANWFIRKRGRALGFMAVGAGISGSLVPGLAWLISEYGWRTTLVLLGFGSWLFVLPLSLLVRHRPEHYGMLPDGDEPQGDVMASKGVGGSAHAAEVVGARSTEVDFTARQALRTRAFWLIALGIGIPGMTLTALIVHLIPFLEGLGLPPEQAALGITGMTLLSLVGRLGFGWLGDIFDKRYVLAAAFGLQAIGALILANMHNWWHIILFWLTFAPGYGAVVPLRPAIQGDYFGRKAFGTIQGVIMFTYQWLTMLSPIFAGWVYDVTGSYRTAFYIFSLAAVTGIPLILAAKRPRLEKAAT